MMFKKLFSELRQIDETANQLQFSGTKIHWKGLSFSAKTICASQIAKQVIDLAISNEELDFMSKVLDYIEETDDNDCEYE